MNRRIIDKDANQLFGRKYGTAETTVKKKRNIND
jgi:hypothetical protein